MGEPRRMTDMEMQAYFRQRAEARKALLVLFGVVGGLAGLAVFLVLSSRSPREADEAPAAKAEAAKAAPTAPAAAPAPTPAPEPAFASKDQVQRAVRDQKADKVAACMAKNGRRAKKAQVTVKLDVAAPDKLAKVDVVSTPKLPALVRCVRAEFKDVTLPRVAANMSVAVPFRHDGARGRRPGR